MTNPMHPLDPIPAPPNVTPADTPSSPLYGTVTPHGRGPAPYNIQADPGDLTAAFKAAGELSGGAENDIYATGPRQAAAEALLQSPAGYGAGGVDIQIGWHGGAGDGWQADVAPGG